MVGPLPARPSGSGSSARFFQWVYDSLQQLLQVRDGGAGVSRTSRGVIIGVAEDTGATAGRVRKLILADHEAANYLICRPWDPLYWSAVRQLRQELGEAPTNEQITAKIAETDEEYVLADLTEYLAKEIIVAKAPELRADDFDGYELDVDVEAWDGATLTVETITYDFTYHSSTLRVKRDITDEENPVSETQVVIPRWVPEFSIIHAMTSDKTEMTVDDQSVRLVDVTQRAWAKVS